MAEPTVDFKGVKEVQSLMDKLPQSVFEDAKSVIRDGVLAAQQKVKARFTSGPLHSRSGEATRSFKTEVSGSSLDQLKASVFSGAVQGHILVYIPVHEFGATGSKAIKAKDKYLGVPGGPYLNIPLAANLTAAGVMREDARDVFNQGGYIFGNRTSGFYVARFDGVPMFVLKKKVEIPARLGFYNIADKEIEIVMKRLSDLLPESWRKL